MEECGNGETGGASAAAAGPPQSPNGEHIPALHFHVFTIAVYEVITFLQIPSFFGVFFNMVSDRLTFYNWLAANKKSRAPSLTPIKC